MEKPAKGRPAPVRNPVGRPTTFTPALADAVLWRVAEGETLRRISESPDMPGFAIVYGWADRDPDFAQRLQRARVIASHNYADQVLEISDDDSNDLTPEGHPNNAAVQRARLKADNRKWMAGKYNPAVYGEKQIHVGPDGMSAVQVQTVYDPTLITPEELYELRRILKKMRGVTLEADDSKYLR